MNTRQEIVREFDVVCKSRFGFLALTVFGNAVSELLVRDDPPPVRTESSPWVEAMAAAVCAYLDTGIAAGLPSVHLEGTDFQRRVWSVLRGIPRGQVRTYGDIASELGSCARAVGGACRANPVMILVPCHRVVATTGLGGFAGSSTGELPALKARLLMAEGVRIA